MKKFFLFLFLVSFFTCYSYANNKITDIKIEGLQRTDPGLVFNSIPFEINDNIENIDYSKTISSLYKTGQFKDIIVEREGSVIVITVREKPLLYELNFTGIKAFQPEALKVALAQMNIASGLILDETDLNNAEKEIKSQYLSMGKYVASVKAEIIPITNNRVNVNFIIDEGQISRIKEINIIGNRSYMNDELLDLIDSKTTNYMSWWNKDDRYSKQVLAGDLEKIKSFYLDRGFLDFRISSSIVSISKNKKDVFISVTLDEGKKYTFGKISVTGLLPEKLSMQDVEKKISVKSGDIFNRKLVNESTGKISKYLGNYGYAFANVTAVPNIDDEKLIVDFNFVIDQGKKIYVRRVNIIGNESSKDEVLRRELRQYESSWFSQQNIDLSKTRLNRTQFFESVNIETSQVPGNSDQVDVNVIVKETNTGKFQIGAGVSSSDGIVGTFGLSQANFLGTGNFVKTDLSLGGVNKVWSLSYSDPYWTEDGVSRGFGIYYRDYNTKDLDIGKYQTNAYGASIDFGIPLSEFKSFKFGSAIDFTEINLGSNSPQKYVNYCNDIGGSASGCDVNSLLFFVSWTDSTIDNMFFPTSGHKLSTSFDISTPGMDLEYYKITAKAEKYFPISNSVTTSIGIGAGFADSYGDDPYPFFKNLRTGGKNSIRGYKEGSVGKKTYDNRSGDWVTYGGKKMISFGTETYFPVPFLKKSEGFRLSAFVDGGAAFEDSINTSDLRYSAGMGLLWMSPFGPLNISIAYPLNDEAHDQTEKLQFGMGSSF